MIAEPGLPARIGDAAACLRFYGDICVADYARRRSARRHLLDAPKSEGERLFAVREMLAYRKDEDFALRDYPEYAWLARHGIVGVRVDIRGTGSSEGSPRRVSTPTRSSPISQTATRELAAMPWSNGKTFALFSRAEFRR